MFLVQDRSNGEDFVATPVTVLEVFQPNGGTGLEYVEVNETGERILVSSNSLIESYFQIGDEVMVTIHYDRESQESSLMGSSIQPTTIRYGDIPTDAVVVSLPSFSPSGFNAGWWQVVATDDGLQRIVAVTRILTRSNDNN